MRREKNWKKALLAVLVMVLVPLVYQDTRADTAARTLTLTVSSSSSTGLNLTAPNCGVASTAAVVPSATLWGNFVPPAVGSTYNDGAGYCSPKRITNIGSGGQMLCEYSLVQCISEADDMLLLFNGDAAHWNIYDFNGNVVISGTAFNTATNINNSEPRWDRFVDNVIWVTTGHSLEKCTIVIGNPGSMSCVTSHTFTEYAYSVVFPADADMNENGWVPMVGQNVEGSTIDVFMYQPNTSTKAGTYTYSCTGEGNSFEPACIHRLESTPNNGMTIEGPSSPVGGDALWLPPFSGAPVAWDPSTGHHATGYEINGTTLVAAFEDFDSTNTGGPCDFRPVIIGFATTSVPGNCPITPPGTTNPPPEFGWHVAYQDHATRPWVVITQQANGTAPQLFGNEAGYAAPVAWNLAGGNWYPYQGAVTIARVDSSVSAVGQSTTQVYQLTLHHARQHAAQYWSDVYASMSWDGKYIVFNSNSAFNPAGCPTGGYTGDCGDTYLIGPLF